MSLETIGTIIPGRGSIGNWRSSHASTAVDPAVLEESAIEILLRGEAGAFEEEQIDEVARLGPSENVRQLRRPQISEGLERNTVEQAHVLGDTADEVDVARESMRRVRAAEGGPSQQRASHQRLRGARAVRRPSCPSSRESTGAHPGGANRVRWGREAASQ